MGAGTMAAWKDETMSVWLVFIGKLMQTRTISPTRDYTWQI